MELYAKTYVVYIYIYIWDKLPNEYGYVPAFMHALCSDGIQVASWILKGKEICVNFFIIMPRGRHIEHTLGLLLLLYSQRSCTHTHIPKFEIYQKPQWFDEV